MEPQPNIVFDFSKRVFVVAVILAGAIALLCLGGLLYTLQASPQNTPHEISVSGEGKAYAKPDIALVSFGVTTQADKSQFAVNQNNAVMNNVIDAIKKLGVDDKDIQTTVYNLSPWYDYTNKGSIFKGYQLNQQIQVKIRNFDIVADVLDKATSNGATNVGSLQFAVDNPEKVQAEARAMAISKAKEKLNDITSESGLQVGRLVNISEGSGSIPQPMYAMGMGGAADSASVAPQIQSGQQEVDVTVTLTYQVK